MANRSGSKNAKACVIRFQDGNYHLSIESLKRQTGATTTMHEKWRSPNLRFLSFHSSQLTLLNTSGTRSFKLIIQVLKDHLVVNCSCGHQHSRICEHAFAGLFKIIWYMGEGYFRKLQPLGLMEMAFAHKRYFDRQESTAGLDIAVRPELSSIFWLAPKAELLNIRSILQLPSATLKQEITRMPSTNTVEVNNTYGMAYLFVIVARNRLLPAIIPCMGTLNKQQSAIKSFRHFQGSLQKESRLHVTGDQQFLNATGYQLWELVETQPGHIINAPAIKFFLKKLTAIFNAWRQMIPVLQKQPFVYSYEVYAVKELKRKLQKHKTKQIGFSIQVPELRFVLKDKPHFYLLQMQVWINNKRVSGCDTRATFFINHQKFFYLLGSIRDAAIAQWMHLSGECIAIFKEHFAKFENEILTPLRRCYSVSIETNGKSKNIS